MRIGILREHKIPAERRVALLPIQCKALAQQFKNLTFFIQSSADRCVPDSAYAEAGVAVVEDLSHCDILLGVKEVPVHCLIPQKTYFFFSHTIKKQAHNQPLLKAILQNNIQLIDYECLADASMNRLVAFGYFAGLVGAYNALWMLGKRTGAFDLPRAYTLANLQAAKQLLQSIALPPVKIAVTGSGRVAQGVLEILQYCGIQTLTPKAFLQYPTTKPVLVTLRSSDYYRPKSPAAAWDNPTFYRFPDLFSADFAKFAYQADMLISAHFWNPNAEPLFTEADMQDPRFQVKIIADITCDVKGSIPATHRVSTISEPVYDLNPYTLQEAPPFSADYHLNVMAVDNLPTELAYDASEAFGRQLMHYVFPALFDQDRDQVLHRATICRQGNLMPIYSYLQDFVDQAEAEEVLE